MLQTLVWGLDDPLVAPVVGRLHDAGVFCIKKWIVGVAEKRTSFFAQREEAEIIEDKFDLNFQKDDVDLPPMWLALG